MNRRAFLAAAASALTPAQTAKRPNILMIMSDDLGYECLGCYGGTSYKTPHLDRIAAEGVRFTHAYAQPLCTPTRLQLMTGLYNNRNWKAFGVFDPHTVTFGHRMQRAGYKTVMAGKWQNWSYNPPDFEPEWRGKGQKAQNAGFDSYCVWHNGHTEDKGSRYGDPTYEENGKLYTDVKGKYGEDVFAGHILDYFGRHRNQPVFAYYPMVLTHGPFNPTPKSKGWDTNRLKGDKAYFKDMVEYMDEVIGRLLARVPNDTLVLYFSDNGTPQGIESRMGDRIVAGGKGKMTDAGTRVPMIAWGQGVTAKGKVYDDLIDSTDFVPTILDAASAPRPTDVTLDGVSFLPRLRGERGAPRDWVFCWHDPRPGWDKEKYKLEVWARDRRWKLYQDGRLIDVPNDEFELHPVSGGAEAEAARKRLKAVLDKQLGS
jgi:arylsulfatase A